jgi:hypothetical protein
MAQIATSLSREATPSVVESSTAISRNRAEIGAMVILIAAERHRMAHGRFPDSIEAIDPAFLATQPIDPFSGKPFYFKSDGDGGLIVYSVGHDKNDGGGMKLEPRKFTENGADVGFRLLSVANRARPSKERTLPRDVFQFIPKPDDETPAP